MSEILDKKLYAKVRAEAKRKYARYPSVYASGWIVRTYKERGGRYAPSQRKSKGISRWMREEWIQVVPYLTKGEKIACGAANKSTKACRPLRRITKQTPATIGELVKLHGKKKVLELARAKNRDMQRRVYWRSGRIAAAKK